MSAEDQQALDALRSAVAQHSIESGASGKYAVIWRDGQAWLEPEAQPSSEPAGHKGI